MSYSCRRRRSRAAGEWAHSQSTWSLPLATRTNEEERQPVERHDVGNENDERDYQPGNQRCHRPILRDRRVQTDDASHGTRAIEWAVTTNSNGVEDPRQVAQNDVNEDEYDGDDEINRNHNEANDDDHRRNHQWFSKPPEQWSRHEPPIAKLVRSQAHRKSSYGRAFFSPSGLQNGAKAMTRYSATEFPLLPMSTHHNSSSLSQAALGFANIKSGDFHLCVKFLREHQSLLRQDYHPYLQEAWKALWDEEKKYAHQCLSRWFLLDECRQIWPRDIAGHINQRTFSGKRFLDKVDDMYKTLKTLRQDVLRHMAQAAEGAPGDASNLTTGWSIRGVRDFFQGVDRARVLSNVGSVYRFVAEVRRELEGRERDLRNAESAGDLQGD